VIGDSWRAPCCFSAANTFPCETVDWPERVLASHHCSSSAASHVEQALASSRSASDTVEDHSNSTPAAVATAAACNDWDVGAVSRGRREPRRASTSRARKTTSRNASDPVSMSWPGREQQLKFAWHAYSKEHGAVEFATRLATRTTIQKNGLVLGMKKMSRRRHQKSKPLSRSRSPSCCLTKEL
jgi:hypothetical protein